jgi:hypothetical protein
MSSCVITFERANGLFRVDRRATFAGKSVDTLAKRVTEGFLLAIGDQDITEAAERAKYDTYHPQIVQSRPARQRRLV